MFLFQKNLLHFTYLTMLIYLTEIIDSNSLKYFFQEFILIEMNVFVSYNTTEQHMNQLRVIWECFTTLMIKTNILIHPNSLGCPCLAVQSHCIPPSQAEVPCWPGFFQSLQFTLLSPTSGLFACANPSIWNVLLPLLPVYHPPNPPHP